MSTNIDIRNREFVPANINVALHESRIPTVLMWNRLESRPKKQQFTKALKAEVRDALWMLTKQWQMGEFKADDAGTPVYAKIHIKNSHLDTYTAAQNNKQNFEDNVPLETKIEQRKIPFIRNGKEISIDIRLQMGQYWLKLVKGSISDFNEISKAYVSKYTFSLPANDRSTDYIYAHKNIWQHYSAISGRSMDGYKLYENLMIAGNTASGDIVDTDPDKTILNNLGLQFITWYNKLYYQPTDEQNNAWIPEKLEYQFKCSATGNNEEKTVSSEEYYQGHLDWYAFDVTEKKVKDNNKARDTYTATFIPAHVQFDGMPNTRWWKFEDGKTSYGDIKPSTTDLSQLLLMEFGLVFANDWFIVPYTLPIGSLANIEGLTVKNNFGELTWIQPSEEAGADDAQWSMYKLSSSVQNNTLFLAPAAMKVNESDPLEEIVFIRDEISNMVWGIETIIPTPIGKGDKAGESALRVRNFHEKIVLLQWLKDNNTFFINLINAIPGLAIGPFGSKSDIEQTIFDLIRNLSGVDNIITQMAVSLNSVKPSFEKNMNELNAGNPDISNLEQDQKAQIATLYSSIKIMLEKAFENIADKTTLNDTLEFLDLKEKKNFAAKVSYLAMTDVPENWIPFVPVHINNSNREISLQRGSMLRIIDNDSLKPPVKIKPLTSILREGIENLPKPLPYFINEEEVPRSGIRVTQSFQRTRWTSGEVFIWLGRQKTIGRGEGSSGLGFDQLVDV